MKVAVMSDTHDNLSVIDEIVERLKNMQLHTIIHLGDYIAPFSLRRFSGFKLYGVFGNNDGEKLHLKKVADENGFVIEEAPFEFELADKKIVAIHGSGSAEKTRRWAETMANGKYDFVLYGHTHRIDIRKIKNTTILNPGEACGYLTGRRSFAVLDLTTEQIEIVEL